MVQLDGKYPEKKEVETDKKALKPGISRNCQQTGVAEDLQIESLAEEL